MEISLTTEFVKWVEEVDDVTIGKLMGKGLSCIRHYHKVHLDLPMLRNVAEHWDSTRHVFRFNQCELCPMIEEFTALMNCNDFKFILLPLKPNKAIELLNECLGIPYSLGRTWIKGEISLKTLVK